jgi:hypothetical protein
MSKRMECFFLFKCRAHTDRADLHFFCGRGGGFFLPENSSCARGAMPLDENERPARAHPDENSMFCKKFSSYLSASSVWATRSLQNLLSRLFLLKEGRNKNAAQIPDHVAAAGLELITYKCAHPHNM